MSKKIPSVMTIEQIGIKTTGVAVVAGVPDLVLYAICATICSRRGVSGLKLDSRPVGRSKDNTGLIHISPYHIGVRTRGVVLSVQHTVGCAVRNTQRPVIVSPVMLT